MGLIMHWLGQWRALRTLSQARALLEAETPLKTNCGKLCGAACCQPEEDGENGMLLFPYEEKLYRQPIPGFPFHLREDDTLVKGGWRLVCQGICPREARPLACRLFPLRIQIVYEGQGENTRGRAQVDPRAWALCPLPREGKGQALSAFSPGFVQAVEAAGDLLLQNVYMLEFLWAEQKLMEDIQRLSPDEP